mmetsp:Transcript_58527/g.67598  ORF Transcript_58527/g.67598 Transcript_58527/m.67598 type:complete len:206 (-) Transcript_58527:40-657(-)
MMRSDLDDLLDEINGTLDDKPTTSKTTQPKFKSDYSTNTYEAKQSYSKPTTYQNKSELDQLLDDLNGATTDVSMKKSYPVSNSTDYSAYNQGTTSYTTEEKKNKKCWQPNLGNKNSPSFSKRDVCEKLRCTSCDLKVQMFHGYKWTADCNYLFFRNYFSNKTQLNSKLIADEDSSAYACQCSWKTVTDVYPISDFKELKWVCAGH